MNSTGEIIMNKYEDYKLYNDLAAEMKIFENNKMVNEFYETQAIVDQLKILIDKINNFIEQVNGKTRYITDFGIDTFIEFNIDDLDANTKNNIINDNDLGNVFINSSGPMNVILSDNKAIALLTFNDVDVTMDIIDVYSQLMDIYENHNIEIRLDKFQYEFMDNGLIEKIEPNYSRSINASVDQMKWADIKKLKYKKIDDYEFNVPILIDNVETRMDNIVDNLNYIKIDEKHLDDDKSSYNIKMFKSFDMEIVNQLHQKELSIDDLSWFRLKSIIKYGSPIISLITNK